VIGTNTCWVLAGFPSERKVHNERKTGQTAGRSGTGQGAAHPAEQSHRAAGTTHRGGGKRGGGRDDACSKLDPRTAGCPAAAECKHHPEARRAGGRRGQHERGGTASENF